MGTMMSAVRRMRAKLSVTPCTCGKVNSYSIDTNELINLAIFVTVIIDHFKNIYKASIQLKKNMKHNCHLTMYV